MQTARDQVFYPIPGDLDCIVRLAIDGRDGSPHQSIRVISAEEMMRRRAEKPGVIGQPAVAAIVMYRNEPALVFHPDPDACYEIDAVYQPHLKKL